MDRKTWAVGITGFCAFFSLYATQPLLPLFQLAFHASKLDVSLTVSAPTIAVALVAPWSGVVADVRQFDRLALAGGLALCPGPVLKA